jgi:putative transposase
VSNLKRAAKTTFTVLSGYSNLVVGHEVARQLWNFTRYCTVSYNRKVQRFREGRIYDQDKEGRWYSHYHSLAGRLPKYTSYYDMLKALRGIEEARTLSDRCFSYTVKEFDIAMRSWFSNLKSNPKARPPRYTQAPRQLTFEVGSNAKSLGDWTYRLTVLGGHVPDRHAVVKVHVPLGIKMRNVKLIRMQPDGTGTIVHYVEQADKCGDGIASIDLGIINLATVAFQTGESILYSGKAILTSDQWYHKRASKCKPSGWHGSGQAQSKQSKRNKSYRRKAGNIRRLAVHNVTRGIINECIGRGVGTIVVGDLRGIRTGKNHGKVGNLKLHAWPFAEFVRQVTYKAEEAGIEVLKVSERYTSKTCHICGAIGSRVERGLFKCHDCDAVINADVNGAFNILNKVSPVRVAAGIGVEGVLSTLPSPSARTGGIGADAQATAKKVRCQSQIGPTFVSKFDLPDWSIVQARCDG